MQLKKSITNINTLQKELSQMSAEVQNNPKRLFEIKKYNTTVGYYISPELGAKLLDYLEEIEMLSDTELIESIVKAKQEISNGGGELLEDVLADIEG